MQQFNPNNKPFCYYVSEANAVVDTEGTKRYFPVVVVEGEPEYFQTDLHYGHTLAQAQDRVDETNLLLDIDKERATQIITSSMFPKPQLLGRTFGDRA